MEDDITYSVAVAPLENGIVDGDRGTCIFYLLSHFLVVQPVSVFIQLSFTFVSVHTPLQALPLC